MVTHGLIRAGHGAIIAACLIVAVHGSAYRPVLPAAWPVGAGNGNGNGNGNAGNFNGNWNSGNNNGNSNLGNGNGNGNAGDNQGNGNVGNGRGNGARRPASRHTSWDRPSRLT
jgi:hypothetical protein